MMERPMIQPETVEAVFIFYLWFGSGHLECCDLHGEYLNMQGRNVVSFGFASGLELLCNVRTLLLSRVGLPCN